MKHYYHIYPTCPNCSEPHKKGFMLEKINSDILCMNCDYCSERFCELNLLSDKNSGNTQYYRCTNCGAVFYTLFNLDDFPNTLDTINRHDEFGKLIPFIWNIESNTIEKNYLDWIKYIDGKFLITWPWDEVKFIPLLLSEYITNFPHNKIVIIDEFSDNTENEFFKPSYYDMCNYLLYSDEYVDFDANLNSECKSFNKSHVLKKVNKYGYHLNLSKYKDLIGMGERDVSEFVMDKSLKEYKNDVVKIIKDKYGKESISSVDFNNKLKKGNENGFINLKFFNRISWSNSKIRFINNKSLWRNISNINNIYRFKQKYSNFELINENFTDFNQNKQIFFISREIEDLFKILPMINPNLVIFPNSDFFIEQYKINKNKTGLSFFNYLKKTNSDCLMFSVKKDSRHLYGFSNENGFIDGLNLKVHTWDNESLLKELKEDTKPSAMSSSFDEIENCPELNISYEKLDILDELEEIKLNFWNYYKNKDIYYFFDGLLKSPLFLEHEDNQKFVYKNYTFEYFRDFDPFFTDDEEIDIINNFLNFCNKYYKNNNPILSKIKEIIIAEFNKSIKPIYIITTIFEKKKLEQILIESEINEYMDYITVLNWNQLNNNINNIPGDSIIISLRYPNISFEMYRSKIKYFIFIGSSKNLDYIKFIIDNRIDENFCTPLYLNIDEMSPNLLKNQIKEVQNIDSATLKEITLEIKNEKEINNNLSDIISTSELSEGDKVILLVNNQNKGLFIPEKHNLTFINSMNNLLDEEKITKKNHETFRNRKILIKQDFIISFKEIFCKYIVENSSGLIISSELYEWKSFQDLIECTYDWRIKLNELVNIIQKNEHLSLDDSKKFLANKLVELDLFAKNPIYIKNFWLKEPIIIKTSVGLIKIFDIDSPKGKDDLFKIYSFLSGYMDNINPEFIALKSEVSRKTLQYFRKSFLKGNNILPEYRHIYNGFVNILRELLSTSDTFKVQYTKYVTLSKNVNPFKIIDNFEDYYD